MGEFSIRAVGFWFLFVGMTPTPAKRKSTGKRLRFEIFARDGFKCRYCGRESSEVQLVLDHVTPVCQGGETTPENLITSCFDCNAGKAGKTIAQVVPGDEDRLRREQELREQERALEIAKRAAKVRIELKEQITAYVLQAFGAIRANEKDIRYLISLYGKYGEIVFEWIDIAASKVAIYHLGPYMNGIRKQHLKDQGETE